MTIRLAIGLWACLALAGEHGLSANLVGGTVAGLIRHHEGHMQLTGQENLLFLGAGHPLRIPFDRIHTLEYGQQVSRRYAEAILISPVLILAKSRKHYVTIGYTDANGRRQALVFQVNKHDVRAVLTGLEAKTGRRVEYQDEEARKSGKG
ncbi:MAG: hypothetical protein M1436_05510 [Acidobacteria bacterium]|nr:hypothetical protein [Acidobacteriota bacterium]